MAIFKGLIRGKPSLEGACAPGAEYDCKTPIQQPANAWPVQNSSFKFDLDSFCREGCDLDKVLVADLFIPLGTLSAGVLGDTSQYHVVAGLPGLTFDIELLSKAAVDANVAAVGSVLAAGVDGAVPSHALLPVGPADKLIGMYGFTPLTPVGALPCMNAKYIGIRIKTLPTPAAVATCAAGPSLSGLKLCIQMDYTPMHCSGIYSHGESTPYDKPSVSSLV